MAFSKRTALSAICRASSTSFRAGIATTSRLSLPLAQTRSQLSPGRRQPLRLFTPTAVFSRWNSSSSSENSSKIWEFKDVQELAARSKDSDSGVILVDTREPGELQAAGRIPTAINIPITTNPESFHITDEEFEDKFGFARPDPDAELVFYCKAGVRSRAAASLARAAGWKNVGEYSGSWLDWVEKGGEVEK